MEDPNARVLVTTKSFPTGQIVGVGQAPAQISYASDLTAYTAELQQIFQSTSQCLVLGARYQAGDIETHSFVQRLVATNQTITPDLTRASVYGYYSYQVAESLQLTAG